MATTTVSTKGQVVLPAELRRRHGWTAGTRLEMVETRQGLLLRAVPVVKPTRLEDVYGILRHDGPPLTIEEMEAAVMREARKHDDRG